MTRITAISLAALTLAGCSLFTPQMQPPQVQLQGVVPDAIGLTEQTFRVVLNLSNPNDRELRVSEARVQLELEGMEMGEGTLVEPVRLPAMGDARVEALVTTDLVSRLPGILGWIASGDTALDYRVTGFVDVGMAGMLRINIDESGRLALPGAMPAEKDKTVSDGNRPAALQEITS